MNYIKKLIKEELMSMLSEEYDYRIQHTAPDKHYGSPLYDLTLNGTYPKGFYNNINHYADNTKHDYESISKIRMYYNKPDALVKVYRAVPAFVKKEYDKKLKKWISDENDDSPRPIVINPGDWVTTSESYAKEHAYDLEGPGVHGKVVSKRIPAKYLWTDGNSINEWGYDPS